MKNNGKDVSGANGKSLKKNVKRTLANKFFSKVSGTPVEVMKRYPKDGETQPCLPIKYLGEVIELAKKATEMSFLTEFMTYLPVAHGKVQGFQEDGIDAFIVDRVLETHTERAGDLLKQMEATYEPLSCLAIREVKTGLKLLAAQEWCSLLKKYGKFIPKEEELVLKAEEDFEMLAAELKIARRTKSLMRRKKKGGETDLQ
jgi:hypothetical protein